MNPSRFKINYVIRTHHGFQTMRDKQHGSTREPSLDCLSDVFLQIPIKSTHRLVQDQELRVTQDGTCQPEALTLPTGKAQSLLSYPGVVFFRQAFDEI